MTRNEERMYARSCLRLANEKADEANEIENFAEKYRNLLSLDELISLDVKVMVLRQMTKELVEGALEYL